VYPVKSWIFHVGGVNRTLAGAPRKSARSENRNERLGVLMRETVSDSEAGSENIAGGLGFKRHLRAEISEGNGAYLFSEQGVVAMRGAQVASVAALLDGTRDLDGLLSECPDGMNAEQVTAVLARLVEAGFVTLRVPGEPSVDERALAYWDACGLDASAVAAREKRSTASVIGIGDGIDTSQVGQALSAGGIEVVDTAAELSIVLCDDYLDPRLARIDAEHRRTGKPWLLARPSGSQVWIGPILQPGESGCWHCLTNRLWGHRHAEACVQEVLGHDGPASFPMPAVPPLTAAAGHLISLEASKWLAGHRHPGQQCVWILDTLDLQGTAARTAPPPAVPRVRRRGNGRRQDRRTCRAEGSEEGDLGRGRAPDAHLGRSPRPLPPPDQPGHRDHQGGRP
jgi:oxazoline/thiazoline synthase